MDRTKKDGTPAKKPGRKPVAKQPPAEEKKVAVLSAQEVAWRRIHELAVAMQREKDDKTVSKWANEITWQCTLIEAMRDC